MELTDRNLRVGTPFPGDNGVTAKIHAFQFATGTGAFEIEDVRSESTARKIMLRHDLVGNCILVCQLLTDPTDCHRSVANDVANLEIDLYVGLGAA